MFQSPFYTQEDRLRDVGGEKSQAHPVAEWDSSPAVPVPKGYVPFYYMICDLHALVASSVKCEHHACLIYLKGLDSSSEMMDEKCPMQVGWVLDTHTHTNMHTCSHVEVWSPRILLLVDYNPERRSQTQLVYPLTQF